MLEVEYSILGPLSVRLAADAAPILLGDKLQLLLGRLLLEPGTTFSADTLAADVWGDETELADQRNTVQVAVRQVRQRLGDTNRDRQAIVSVGAGYLLQVVDPLRIDAERFRQLARRGSALVREHPRAARAMLAEALGCWRGRVLGDHAGVPWVAPHAVELDRMRDLAEVDLNEARLRLGEHAGLEATLRRQLVEHPEDERRWAQLVRALDGAGRSAEAALAYRDAARELGALGPELRQLGDRIGRGLPAESRPAATASGLLAPQPVAPVLCAALTTRPAAGAPGLGTVALHIDRAGGVPYPLGERGVIAVFPDADAACAAAGALVADGRLKAAVAVHVGPVRPLGDGLVGAGAARCRLLARAANPGQVLVSAEAAAGLSEAVPLQDRGEVRLEDLLPGEHVLELVRDDAPQLPAPYTLSSRPNNLPVQQTRFVGRAHELAELARALAAGQLVTLLGVGGCGKTRLALQLAARRAAAFSDGAWFAELSELARGVDGEGLASSIADQLGIRPLPGETASGALERHLSDRTLMLILDNCEHVIDACVELVPRLRAAAPRACLLLTSREPLRIDGEAVVEVPPMSTGATSDPDVLPDAVALLLDRAGPLPEADDAEDVLADATRICLAFEGSPLAIELAAAHVATRGLAGVAAEVESMLRGELGLDFFASKDPRRKPRQRTIEAAIRWSHELLDPTEADVLHRLSVFRGSFGFEEAKQVVAHAALEPKAVAEVLRRLIDGSMVSAASPLDGAPRLCLGQPIRAFAAAHLGEPERDEVRRRHVETYAALATRTAPRLFDAGERAALERLEADHDNLRAALAQLIEERRAPEALEMVNALWWFWFSHGHFEEGFTWVRAALALDDRDSRERVRALRAASHLAWWRGEYAESDRYNHAIEACARAIGDEWGLAWAPMGYGAVLLFHDPRRALLLFEDSRRRFQALGRDWEAAYALQLVGAAHWFAGDEAAAEEGYDAASETFERLGHGSVLASVRRGAGLMAARCGRPDRGAALCREALRITDALGDRAGSAQALNFLAAISRDEGDLDAAIQRFADALARAREIGELWATCSALDGIAGGACALGEPELAARLLSRSKRLADRAGYRQSAHEQQLRARDVDALVRQLGERDYVRAVAEGESMTVGDAVAAALGFATRHQR